MWRLWAFPDPMPFTQLQRWSDQRWPSLVQTPSTADDEVISMMMVKWCLMSSDVSWHIRDKLWPMPKHGSIILYVSTLTQLLNYDQALVYDILPSTTAVFSYAICPRKLSANEQFFWWCSNSSKFFTSNSNKTRRVVYSRQQSLHQRK